MVDRAKVKKKPDDRVGGRTVEKTCFLGFFWEEQKNRPLVLGHLGYGVSRRHRNQNEPFQWHVGQHTRRLDGPTEFLSPGVYSPPFSSLAVISAYSLPTVPHHRS